MTPKTFRLALAELKPLAVGHGACLATDRITVDGEAVGFCYREEPANGVDSGWRFMAGDETQEYADDPCNWAFYDVNTIANYEAGITSIIEAPVGSAFERDQFGRFIAADV